MWAAASALQSVGQAFFDAAEGPASAPPNGVSRNAWSVLRGAVSVAGPLVNAAAHSVERKMRQGQMPRAAQDALMIGLLASRLSEAAYCHDADCLSAMLSAVPPDEAPGLKLLHFSPQGDHTDRLPQWYLARDEGGAGGGTRLFLVFRGTFSPHDVLRDLLVTPEAHGDATFHGGFLAGVSEDPALHKVLGALLKQEKPAELILLGHSLGGSLALTFLAAGFVPAWYRKQGKLTAVAIGSPAVLFTPHSPGAGGERPATAPVRCPAAAAGARVLVFVNRADAVPRLLGSPLPVVRGLFSGALRRERQKQALATLEAYSHLPHTEVVWLNPEGLALAVPKADRDAVLHLCASTLAPSTSLAPCRITEFACLQRPSFLPYALLPASHFPHLPIYFFVAPQAHRDTLIPAPIHHLPTFVTFAPGPPLLHHVAFTRRPPPHLLAYNRPL